MSAARSHDSLLVPISDLMPSTSYLFKRLAPDEVPALRHDPIDAQTLSAAAKIVEDVRARGEAAVREHAQRLGDIKPDQPLIYSQAELNAALRAIPAADRALLERTAERITAFARAQREALKDIEVEIPGGRAGHRVRAVERAGCYAPGGRFPLPSSVLMTACTARAAGVQQIWVASPRPDAITLAAAAVAGADGLLAVGGAQAIAAMAWGAGVLPACDVVVGPGNRWVTAAKKLIAGQVRIDMLAGPSELVILADRTAEAATVAADLLAQAEHDPDALPILITLDKALQDGVEAELERQLKTLPTAEIARAALKNGFSVHVDSLEEGVRLCDQLAPEHLELLLEDPAQAAERARHYGGLFVGALAAEVLGDYGAGPNHTLPTGGSARVAGGLSVHTFLAIRTWMTIDNPAQAAQLVDDAARLARLEGLEAHARSAEKRRGS